MPFGNSAIGSRRVSCVGVTADLASHSSGPSADDEQHDQQQRVASRRAVPTTRRRQSDAETMPRAVVGGRRRPVRRVGARSAVAAGCAVGTGRASGRGGRRHDVLQGRVSRK